MILERVTRFFRNRDAHPWRAAAEATMSPAERAFVEESPEDRDADAIVRATFGGGSPDRLLGFPDERDRR